MIVHQTVTPHLYSFFSTAMTEDPEIKPFVTCIEIDDLSSVTSLDDMMRIARYDNSGNSSHYIVFDGQEN